MNHAETCTCPSCLMADMDAHLRTIGIAPEAYEGPTTDTAERTRYATPGTACGRGVVRKVSPAQVALIRRLMAERDTSTLTRLPGSENIEAMSLRGASDLIERLQACKEIPAKAAAANLATEAQVRYATTLAAQKGLALTADDFAKQTKRDVSKAIDMMRAMVDAPKPATARAGEVTEDGMYRNPTTGEIFKVQVAVHGSGKLYAKKLVKLDTPVIKRGKEFSYGFEFASGAIRTLRPEWKMDITEAAEFGRLYGCCIRCGAVLTLEESIERGMGSWCAGKF